MGRRFSRFRRASQQVVKVTRRIFTMCYCGEVRTETEVKVVPVASVLNGSITSTKYPQSHRSCFSSVHSGCEHAAPEEVHESATVCSHYSSLGRRRGTGTCIAARPRLIVVEPLNASKESSQGDSERGHLSLCGSNKGTEENESNQDEVTLYYAVSEKWAQISPIEVQMLGNLAQGYFGDIDLVISSDGSSGKFIRKKLTTTASYQEAATLCQCDYVVKLLACFTTKDATYLYMPYYCRRDLDYWLERNPDRQVFGEPQANFIMLHLLVAIYSIHKIAVLHMDIKPGNIFIDNNGYPVLADFGGALRTDQALRAHCFTLDYSSPEVRMRLLADKMADLWSAACTYYDIIANKVPSLDFEMKDEEVIACRNVGFNTSNNFSPVAAEFISAQLELDLTKRLGFREGAVEVMRHPVFQGNDWNTVKDRAAGKPSPLCGIFPVLMGQTRVSYKKKCKNTFVKR